MAFSTKIKLEPPFTSCNVQVFFMHPDPSYSLGVRFLFFVFCFFSASGSFGLFASGRDQVGLRLLRGTKPRAVLPGSFDRSGVRRETFGAFISLKDDFLGINLIPGWGYDAVTMTKALTWEPLILLLEV